MSFECRSGEVHALAGENGAGKSTLVKIISGAHSPDSGEIEFDGQTYDSLTTAEARRLGISVIYQDFDLFPDLTVAENIHFGVEPRRPWGGTDYRRMHRQTEYSLARLNARIAPKRLVRELSIAEQQLVEIAKALIKDAKVLIMDEPSAVLAERELDELFDVIRRLRTEGVGIVYISHRLGEVFTIADRVTVLKDGRNVDTWDVDDLSPDQLIEAMIGRPLSSHFPERGAGAGDVLLRIRQLAAGEPGRGIEDVSFDLHHGEILGIGGLVGSGRTTLARAIVGLEERRSGSILIDGEELERSSSKAIARGVVMVPEDRKSDGVFVDKSVKFNITLPNLTPLASGGFISRRKEREYAFEAISKIDLRPPNPDRSVGSLSGGNQQKVVLARWLAMRPSVVIVDEPTRGIDVGAKEEIYQQLRDLTRRGVGVLMISSDMSELLGMSDRLLVMHEGRLAGELLPAEASERQVMNLASGREHAPTP